MFYYVFGNNNTGGLFSFYLFISLFFGGSVCCLWPVLTGTGDWAEGLQRECCLFSASEWTSARNSQPGVIYLFLECDHYFFWQMATPNSFSLRDFCLSTSVIIVQGTPLAFSIVFFWSRGLWAVPDRVMVAGSHLVSPCFPGMETKPDDPTSQRHSSLGCVPSTKMWITAWQVMQVGQALERVAGVPVQLSPSKWEGLICLSAGLCVTSNGTENQCSKWIRPRD